MDQFTAKKVFEIFAMKTIFIIYMPGCAGNFLARLFGLSPEVMPLMTKNKLDQLVHSNTAIDQNWPKFESYQFTQVLTQYPTWQEFHRDWIDFKDYSKLRWLNLLSESKFAATLYCIHPYEMQKWYFQMPPEDFYHVELDFDLWGHWLQKEKDRLQFAWRPNEDQLYETMKIQYSSKSIDLTTMLASTDAFVDEYLRVCQLMQVSSSVDLALELRRDWYQTRVACYE